MSRGNPNQAKLVKELKSMGYKVKVKHNQIHVEGVRYSPYHDGVEGWSVPEGQTYGMTMSEAQLFIVNNRKEVVRMSEEEHPCFGCKLFTYWTESITHCDAGLPIKRDDGLCYVGDD